MFKNCRKKGLTIRESAKLTIKEASVIWSKARIPIRQEYHCIAKLEKLFHEWKNLQKNKNRPGTLFRTREMAFVVSGDNLFDIAHADAMRMIKMEEDKIYLKLQRQNGRPDYLTGSDTLLANKENRKAEPESKKQRASR